EKLIIFLMIEGLNVGYTPCGTHESESSTAASAALEAWILQVQAPLPGEPRSGTSGPLNSISVLSTQSPPHRLEHQFPAYSRPRHATRPSCLALPALSAVNMVANYLRQQLLHTTRTVVAIIDTFTTATDCICEWLLCLLLDPIRRWFGGRNLLLQQLRCMQVEYCSLKFQQPKISGKSAKM
ncbi:unnamed protein product, partial [Ceratitis capitata]